MIKRIKLEKVLIEKSLFSYYPDEFLNNKQLKKTFTRGDAFNNLIDDLKDSNAFNNLKDEDGEFSEEAIDKIQNYEFKNRVFETLEKLKDSIDENGKITIYRAMMVREDFINYLLKEGKHLGIFWSFSIHGADTYWEDDKQSKGMNRIKVVITSEVDEKNVNWFETIELNMDLSIGDSENEIRLFKGTPLKIISIKSGKEELDISKIKDKTFYA